MENTITADEYEKFTAKYNAAMNLALARITNLNILQEGNPCVIVKRRIKSYKSTERKCNKKGCNLDIESIQSNVRDIAGIRIIVDFLDDTYRVVKMLEHTPGINVTRKKDYIAKPKPSGYRSIHLEIQVEIYNPVSGSELVPVEIQIRDNSQHAWAALEHKVYEVKQAKDYELDSSIIERLRKIADDMHQRDIETQECVNAILEEQKPAT